MTMKNVKLIPQCHPEPEVPAKDPLWISKLVRDNVNVIFDF